MFERIMLPLDLDEPSSWAKALPVAVAFAEANRSNLSLATVISDWVATRDVQWSPLGYRRLVKDAELRQVMFQRIGDEFIDEPERGDKLMSDLSLMVEQWTGLGGVREVRP